MKLDPLTHTKVRFDQSYEIKLKFVYSEKAIKFCEIDTLLLSTVHTDKSKVEISQNFVAFSEYMNFKCSLLLKEAPIFIQPSILKQPKGQK